MLGEELSWWSDALFSRESTFLSEKDRCEDDHFLCVYASCRLEGGELFDYVIAKDYLQESEGSYYMKQILEGLAFCHSKSIVHLDLKVELCVCVCVCVCVHVYIRSLCILQHPHDIVVWNL